MPKKIKRDNTTFSRKLTLRREVMRTLAVQGLAPVVMETHGGFGAVWDAVYRSVERGAVFEKEPKRCDALILQRPGWSVYQTDCELAIREGAGAHLSVNVLDVDPYGSAWPTLKAFFESERPRDSKLSVVVADGLRLVIQRGGIADMHGFEWFSHRFGNSPYSHYLECCQTAIREIAAARGYRLETWAGYYCGRNDQMTHWWAALRRD